MDGKDTIKKRHTVVVSDKTWKRLNELRDSPSDTFDSVVNKLIEGVLDGFRKKQEDALHSDKK
jgi:hypothetical protein